MKILLINGGAYFNTKSAGVLNDSLHEVAKNTLLSLGHELEETIISNGYEIELEANKFKWADLIIYQFPIWWFGQPWPLKKYIDELFTLGGFYESSRGFKLDELPGVYGYLGVLKNKQVMINTTQAAPKDAYEHKSHFFEGASLTSILNPIYKQNEFIGIKKFLPSYDCYEVYHCNQKALLDGYKDHLIKHLGNK